ncbi:hypothetical protein SAMN02745129_0276 [Ferrimonas marina]|uniref:Rap1a immunity protein domain-containing protein n=2 Tax=Ferrimonas marina TaxID=299255 RepID=A0A1M5ZG55_9GAMM|nr:hypothetical protein SAMN02745129_0276 [Ferrimonas marina]
MLAVAMPPAWASDINLVQCQEKPRSSHCLAYLEGAVDGALAMGALVQPQPMATSTLSERALKYRSGKRFKQANQAICEQQKPERDQLVLALDELVAAGSLNTQKDLQQALMALMACQ